MPAERTGSVLKSPGVDLLRIPGVRDEREQISLLRAGLFAFRRAFGFRLLFVLALRIVALCHREVLSEKLRKQNRLLFLV